MLGVARMMTLDNEGALKEFERAIQLNPKLPGVHTRAANAILSLGDPARAASEYRLELEVNPNDFDANLLLGVLLRKEEKLDEAMRYLSRALEIRPGTPDALYQIALVHLGSDNVRAALALLESLVARHPNFAEAHVSLATVYYRLNRKADGDREREVVRKLTAERQADSISGRPQALRQAEGLSAEPAARPAKAPVANRSEPASPTAPASAASFESLSARASAEREAGRSDEAVALYRRAVCLKPSFAEGWWYLGTLYYDRDRYAEARHAFNRFVALKPKAGPAFAMLGLCEFRLAQYKDALVHIERGRHLGLGGDEEFQRVARYHSAILQTRFGEPESALRILHALARTNEHSPDSPLEALGLAALRLPLLPADITTDKRDMILLAGRAQALVAARNRIEASKAFAELLANHPSSPGVHYSYGVFLLAEDSDKAIEELKRELTISPDHDVARLQLAFEYLRRGEFGAGLPYAEWAVERAPDKFAGRNALGRLLLGLDQVERAVRELEMGVKLAPTSPETRFALATAYARAGRKDDAARERAAFSRLDAERRKRDAAAPGVKPQ